MDPVGELSIATFLNQYNLLTEPYCLSLYLQINEALNPHKKLLFAAGGDYHRYPQLIQKQRLTVRYLTLIYTSSMQTGLKARRTFYMKGQKDFKSQKIRAFSVR